MKQANDLEIEAKFFIRDLPAMRATLLKAGATLTKERVFERNIRYDNEWGGLDRKRAILRLRQDSRTIITYKGIPADLALLNSEVRIREELEIIVDDFEMADKLLRRIGFYPQTQYEKYRETFALGACEVVLDELPFGDFIEIEGTEEGIMAAVNQLGLNWSERINKSYLSLFKRFKRHTNLPLRTLTFSEFEPVTTSIADIIDPVISSN